MEITLKEALEKFQITGTLLGEGAYGKVMLVHDKLTNEQYALKRIVCQNPEDLESAQNENYNVVKIHYYLIEKIQTLLMDQTNFNIIMELADNTLANEIKFRQQNKNYFTQKEIYHIFFGLINTLYVMSIDKVAHRDIKPQNILNIRGKYKLCDFGTAVIRIKTYGTTIVGTQAYISPLIMWASKNDDLPNDNVFKSDVFSLGVTIMTCLLLKQSSGLNEEGGQSKIEQKIQKLAELDLYDNKFLFLLERMLDWDEKARWTIKEIYTELYSIINGDTLKLTLEQSIKLEETKQPEDLNEETKVSDIQKFKIFQKKKIIYEYEKEYQVTGAFSLEYLPNVQQEIQDKFYLTNDQNYYLIWFVRNKKKNFDILQDIVAKIKHKDIQGLYFDQKLQRLQYMKFLTDNRVWDNIKFLAFNKCGLVDDIAKYFLNALENFQNLKYLQLNSNYEMNDGFIKQLVNCTVFQKIEYFSIDGCQNLTKVSFEYMFRKSNIQVYSLLEINLSDLLITDDTLKLLADSPKMINLVSIILRKCLDVTDRGIEHITKTKYLMNLSKINLYNMNQLSSVILRYLNQATFKQKLEYLNVKFCSGISGRDFKNLFNIEDNFLNYIKQLKISQNDIDDEFLNLVATSNCTKNLGFLQLWNCKAITDKGIKELFNSKTLRNIYRLSFVGLPKISDEILYQIGNTSIFDQLATLTLSFCSKISTKGFAQLLQSKNIQKIQQIYIEGCPQIDVLKVQQMSKDFKNLQLFFTETVGLMD